MSVLLLQSSILLHQMCLSWNYVNVVFILYLTSFIGHYITDIYVQSEVKPPLSCTVNCVPVVYIPISQWY